MTPEHVQLQPFRYKGYSNVDSECYIDIYRFPDLRPIETAQQTTDIGVTIVVCSQIKENAGTSITNMAAHIATRVCAEYDIDPLSLIWIEKYPPHKDSRCPEDRLSLVYFELGEANARYNSLRHPNWKHLPANALPAIIEKGHWSWQMLALRKITIPIKVRNEG